MVLEKEAESLKVLRSRLADESLYQTDKATKRKKILWNLSTQKEVSHRDITMAREENGRGGNLNAEGRDPTKTIYLVMPSYAEPHKKEIRNILYRIISNISQIFKIRFSCKNFQRIFKNMIK